jgi:hypothetical protein
MLRVLFWANPLHTNRERYAKGSPRASRPLRLGPSQGRIQGFAVIPLTNNTLNVARAFLGESFAYEPSALRERIAVCFAVLPESNNTLNESRAGLGDNPVCCRKVPPLCGGETYDLCGALSAVFRVCGGDWMPCQGAKQVAA